MNKMVKKEVESSCEYILPDYMGDIKKILYSKAQSIPAGKYVSGSDAEHNGVVEYEILYADTDNRLTAVTASSDYSVTVSCSDGEISDSFHKCKIAGFAVRTTGPRKLTMKSVVETNTAIVREDDDEGLFDGADGEGLQKNTVQIKSEVYKHIATSEREIAEEIGRLNGVSKDDVEIILNSADVRISDIKVSDKGVCVRGEMIVETVRRVEDTPPYSTKKSYPFEHVISPEKLSDEMKLTATGIASSVTVGMSEEGEETVLTLNGIAELNLYGSYNSTKTVTVDAYSVDSESENYYSDLEYMTLTDLMNAEFHLDERVDKSTLGLNTVRDILIARADAVCSGCEIDHHSVKINGEISISGVACEINESDEICYTPFKHSFPFSHNVNSNCQIGSNDLIECELCSTLADVGIDSDELYLKVTVDAAIKACAKNKIKYLSECKLCGDEFVRPSRSRITVYYPTATDSLFDIAKKHHTTTEKLCADNSISYEASSVSGNILPKKLIIK